MAVNGFDAEAVIQKYVTDKRVTFKVVMGGPGEQYTLGKAYGVRVYPANFLVDPAGRIVWRAIGFNEAAMRGALAQLGLK